MVKAKVVEPKRTTSNHILCAGNRMRILASREAIGAMKYKSQ